MNRKLNVYFLFLCLIFFTSSGANAEISVASDKKKELDDQEIEIINNYDLLEIFDMLVEWDLFDNYEVFIDTTSE